MTRAAATRAGLVVAFALTVPLPVVAGVQLLAGAEVEPFLVSLGLLTMVGAGVGATILWRRPGNRVGMLLLAGALMLALAASSWPWLETIGPKPSGLVETIVAWWTPIAVLPAVFVFFPTVVLVFPDGDLPSSAWRWPFAVATGSLVIGTGLQAIAPWPVDAASGLFGNPVTVPGVPPEARVLGEGLAIVSVFVAFVLALVSVVVRFRRSLGVERAQVKWLAAAVALNCVLFPLSYATPIQPETVLDVASVAAAALIPIAIGIAITRYRLYEIDRIVSRTLSWAIVSGLLVATFAALVLGLQALLTGVTQGQTLAVAASTLVAFALFQPVRRRVQEAVDRRFDRAHYDAQQTAQAFADRLRDEVDLDALADELERTAVGAIRPTAATLWLPAREGRP